MWDRFLITFRSRFANIITSGDMYKSVMLMYRIALFVAAWTLQSARLIKHAHNTEKALRYAVNFAKSKNTHLHQPLPLVLAKLLVPW